MHGVEVVPVSVLLSTLSNAAAGLGISTLTDLRFEYPIVVDRPRVIRVCAGATRSRCPRAAHRGLPQIAGPGTAAPSWAGLPMPHRPDTTLGPDTIWRRR